MHNHCSLQGAARCLLILVHTLLIGLHGFKCSLRQAGRSPRAASGRYEYLADVGAKTLGPCRDDHRFALKKNGRSREFKVAMAMCLRHPARQFQTKAAPASQGATKFALNPQPLSGYTARG